MARPNMYPQNAFDVYVATEAAVPGKDGASPTLIAQFDALPRGAFVFVQEDGAIYCKPKAGFYTADGNRIVLVSSGSSGSDGVDGIFSNAVTVPPIAVGSVVSKDINPNNVVLADANDPTKSAFGVVIDVIDTVTCVVREFGECVPAQDAAFTVGATVYLSENAGKATTLAPTTAGCVAQKIGTAKSATEVILGITPAFGGGLYTKDGTVAQPAWSFVGQPGTGLYLSSSTIGVGINGVNVATMSATGFGYSIVNATNNGLSIVATLTHEATTAPAAGIASALAFSAEAQAGVNVLAGVIAGAFSNVGAGTEVGQVLALPSYAGTRASAGLLVDGLYGSVGSLDTGLALRPIPNAVAVGTGVELVPYSTNGATVNIDLQIGGAGTGILRATTEIEMSSPSISAAAGSGSSFILTGATNANVEINLLGTGGNILLNGTANGGVQVGVNAASKVGFYATAPIAKQTGVAITAGAIHAALVALGLIAGP